MKTIILLCLLLSLFSCDYVIYGDDEEKAELFKEGITHFENERYEQAETTFELALEVGTDVGKDVAHTMIGYSQLRQKEYTNAHQSFTEALTFDPNQADAKVGNLLLQYAYFKNYPRVLELGTEVLSLSSSYVFAFDKTIDYKDVILHMAFADFHEKDYTSSYGRLSGLTTQTLNPSSSNFSHELSNLLHQLSQQLN